MRPRRELGWELDELRAELNELVRLRVGVLRPHDLRGAVGLLGLPRYAEPEDEDEQLRLLHADLCWVVKHGLPADLRLPAQFLLRPRALSADLFVAGEEATLLGHREEALRRRLQFGEGALRAMRWERKPLLDRVAFALFQLGLRVSPDFVRGFVIDDFETSVLLHDKKTRTYWHSFTLTLLREEVNVIAAWHHFGPEVEASPPRLIVPKEHDEYALPLRRGYGRQEYALMTSCVRPGEPTEVAIEWSATTSPRQAPFLDARAEFPVDSLTLKVVASPALVSFYRVVELPMLSDQELAGSASELLSREDQSPIVVTVESPPLRAGYRIHWIPQ